MHLVRYVFGFDLTVHQDAAANAVTIALRQDISHDRRLGDRELQRPRQACSLNMLRVGIAVEIADVCHGPWWAEDLVRQVLGVEGPTVVNVAAGIRGAFLRAEDAVQPRHSQPAGTDHREHKERNPQPPQNPENRKSPPPVAAPGASRSNMQLHIGRDSPDGGTSIAVGVAG